MPSLIHFEVCLYIFTVSIITTTEESSLHKFSASYVEWQCFMVRCCYRKGFKIFLIDWTPYICSFIKFLTLVLHSSPSTGKIKNIWSFTSLTLTNSCGKFFLKAVTHSVKKLVAFYGTSRFISLPLVTTLSQMLPVPHLTILYLL